MSFQIYEEKKCKQCLIKRNSNKKAQRFPLDCHSYCFYCLQKNWGKQLKKNNIDFKCPDESCDTKIEMKVLEIVLTAEKFKDYKQIKDYIKKKGELRPPIDTFGSEDVFFQVGESTKASNKFSGTQTIPNIHEIPEKELPANQIIIFEEEILQNIIFCEEPEERNENTIQISLKKCPKCKISMLHKANKKLLFCKNCNLNYCKQCKRFIEYEVKCVCSENDVKINIPEHDIKMKKKQKAPCCALI